MPWARFEVLSGFLNGLLIIFVVVLLVQMRIVRRSLKRMRSKPSFSSGEVLSPEPVRAPYFNKETEEDREIIAKERKKLEHLVRETEQLRSELAILFYDVQRFMEEGAPSAKEISSKDEDGTRESEEMYALPEEDSALPSVESEPMKETVIRLSREGRTIPEIAAAIGRGEGEVAFLLSMEKVGRA